MTDRMRARAEELLQGVLCCPVGDSLRYRRPGRFRRAWLRLRTRSWDATAVSEALTLCEAADLIVIGPETRTTKHLDPVLAGRFVLDFSGLAGSGPDPRRRTLDEDWFRLARHSADTALDLMANCLGEALGVAVAKHKDALHLRLKADIAIRLRRLEIVSSEVARRPVRHAVVIEGEQPADDMEAALLAADVIVSRVSLAAQGGAQRRYRLRARGQRVAPSAATRPLLQIMKHWLPRRFDSGGRGVLAADLRKADDFRHAATAQALLRRMSHTPGLSSAILLQPYTRLTANTVRALKIAGRLGASSCLVRQPQITNWTAQLAGLRALVLTQTDRKLAAGITVAQRISIAEGVGGFILSSLGPSLALCQGLERSMREKPPAFVAALPLGSPFGGLVMSAARSAGAPTVEVQTLMIGVSERDPAPIADRVAVLDTEQRAIFERRFGVNRNRFILAGAQGSSATDAELGAGLADGAVLFASQPLDDVCVSAAKVLAEACVETQIPLRIAPHPDETDADLEAYRRLLARYPTLDASLLPRGTARGAVDGCLVLATVVSNMAMWAAAKGRDVLVVDVGVSVALDFPRMGVALKAASVKEAVVMLEDFRSAGPLSKILAQSRSAFFNDNPQALKGDAASQVVTAMLASHD